MQSIKDELKLLSMTNDDIFMSCLSVLIFFGCFCFSFPLKVRFGMNSILRLQ